MSDLLALLAGGLSFLNGVVQLLLKLAELWEKFNQDRRQKGKNKRSTKRNSSKNP